MRALRFLDGLDRFFYLFRDFLTCVVERVPFLGRKPEIVGLLQRLAVHDREHRDAGRGHLDGEALLDRPGLALLHQLLPFCDEFFDHLARFGLVRFVVEDCPDVTAEVLKQLLELTPQFGAGAAGEAQGAWPVGLIEVVDVAPVVYGCVSVVPGPLTHGFGQVGPYDGVLAGAGETGNEDVVAGFLDAQAESERGDGAVLADERGRRLDLIGAVERKAGRIASPAKSPGCQFETIGVHLHLSSCRGVGPTP